MTTLTKGTEIAGRFVVTEEIAAGGMGAVYRARQTSLDREVALKVLHSEVAFTARARRRFGREARAVARLNHPHIAGVFDFGTDNDDQTLWLAMELVDGESLNGLKRDSIDILRIVSLTDQILSALSAAHARGIIHRDLKPSNILLTNDEEGREIIKLVDFGLAATHTDALSLDGAPGGLDAETEVDEQSRKVILGTPRYMAPELFQRKPARPGVDLYALGIILYEVLAGVPPYRGDDPRQLMRDHLRKPIPRLQPREGSVPPELEHCIYMLLAKDPGERFQTAAEVREAIQVVINQFSYVPWAVTGPGTGRATSPSDPRHPGNLSVPGFLGGHAGGRTIPPSAMVRGDVSQFGPGGAPQAPLVGRDRERRTVERLVRKTVDSNQGAILFLEGEAGIGKSRLLEWVRVRIEEAGIMRVAHGIFTRGGSSFGAVRDVLATILGTEDLAPDRLAEHLADHLGQWRFSGEEAELCLQLMTPGGDVAIFEDDDQDSGVSMHERIFAMIENVLRCASRTKPWMLVFEDLHYAGDETLDFLQHLAVGMHLDPMPVLITSTLRVEEIEQIPQMRYALERLERLGPEHVVRLELTQLDEMEASSLVRKLAPVDDELASQIARRASGNPLHITQILGYLQESGKLDWIDGAWSLIDGVDIQAELPDELAELMRYRLTRLAAGSDDAEAVRAILDRAAVLGKRFDYGLLRSFVDLEDNQPWLTELDDVLENLVSDGYFREVGTGGRDTMEFTHVVMRDVLLQDLEGRRSQRHLHRVAADAKKAHYGERYRDHALEFVEHYRQAKEPTGVYAYTVKAAKNAADAADLREAMKLYRDAKELAEDNQISVENPLIDGVSGVLSSEEVGLEVAHLERRIGEYDSARDHYGRQMDHDNPVVALWSRWGLGEIDRRQGDIKDAKTWFDNTRSELKEIWRTSRSKEIRRNLQTIDTYARFGLGQLAHARGLYENARVQLSQVFEQAQKIGDRGLQAKILRLLGDTYWRLGDNQNAEVHVRQAAIVEESLADPQIQAFGLLYSARFLREVGQSQKAKEHAQRALEITEKLEQLHDSAEAHLILGHLAYSRGNSKAAASHLRQAHKTYERYFDRRGIAQCNLALAHLAFSVERHRETQSLALEAMDTFRAIGDLAGLTQGRLLIGRLELALDRPQRALKPLSESVQHFDKIGERRLIACARALYALALMRTDALEEARLVLEKVLNDAAELRLAEESFASALEEIEPLLSDSQPELAARISEIRAEVWQRLGRTVATTV